MALPFRKDRPQEELSTADLAHRKPPSTTENARAIPLPPETERTESATVGETPQQADSTPLFPHDELEGLRGRWTAIQGTFVDEPRKAVEEADALVASAMQRLAEVFSEERDRLEKQWDQGDNVSTEDLRIALQRYRSFFHRLLAV
ncbi:MAG TPA: hypothetical protein VJQ82_00510 [Terriglobales bacterium]|nr:hypothetical protein [Terriglobales bacterium]